MSDLSEFVYKKYKHHNCELYFVVCSTLVLHSGHSSCFPLKNKHGCILSLSATQLTSITLTAWGSLSHHEEYISVSLKSDEHFIKAFAMAESVLNMIPKYVSTLQTQE